MNPSISYNFYLINFIIAANNAYRSLTIKLHRRKTTQCRILIHLLTLHFSGFTLKTLFVHLREFTIFSPKGASIAYCRLTLNSDFTPIMGPHRRQTLSTAICFFIPCHSAVFSSGYAWIYRQSITMLCYPTCRTIITFLVIWGLLYSYRPIYHLPFASLIIALSKFTFYQIHSCPPSLFHGVFSLSSLATVFYPWI